MTIDQLLNKIDGMWENRRSLPHGFGAAVLRLAVDNGRDFRRLLKLWRDIHRARQRRMPR